ncbi:MAG: FAD-dependent oxidoreductase [Myxococcota bacterium]|jgi:D-arginine dehydrogenase|nr:FAD-dependent oxidoreductase [Myxococcota bacterium]
MQETPILIVGGGIAGLTTAWHLAKSGCGSSVVLLEAENQLGSHSTALNAAILRTLGPDPISTRIGLQSAEFLRNPPPGFSEVPLIDALGLVLVAAPGREEELRAWVGGLEVPEGHVEELDREGLRAAMPGFEAEVGAAWSFPREGRLDIAAIVAGFTRGARQGGVEIRRGVRVSSLLEEAGRVVGVRLDDGSSVRGETTVLAAGGWAQALGRSAGSRVRLRPTLRHLGVTAPVASVERSWPVVWYFGSSAEEEFYCRPEGGGMMVSACEVVDADPDRFETVDECRTEIARKCGVYLPLLEESGLAHFWCGMRTLTDDGNFVVGADPDRPGLFWVAGLGGSGMVASAEVGRIASALLCGEDVEPEFVKALSPERSAVRG